jgi:hypothetical protein
MNTVSGRKMRTLLAILFGVVAGSAFGYWGYAEYREYEARATILEIVADTSRRLRDAFGDEAAAAGDPAALIRLYDHAQAVESALKQMRALDPLRFTAAAEAADDYVLTAREILLRRASSLRQQLQLRQELRALERHMRRDDGSATWVTEAVRMKTWIEEGLRDYRRITEVLGTLLASFPASQARIAPYAATELLLPENLATDARRRVLDSATQMVAEVRQTANLNTYR